MMSLILFEVQTKLNSSFKICSNFEQIHNLNTFLSRTRIKKAWLFLIKFEIDLLLRKYI